MDMSSPRPNSNIQKKFGRSKDDDSGGDAILDEVSISCSSTRQSSSTGRRRTRNDKKKSTTTTGDTTTKRSARSNAEMNHGMSGSNSNIPKVDDSISEYSICQTEDSGKFSIDIDIGYTTTSHLTISFTSFETTAIREITTTIESAFYIQSQTTRISSNR